MSYQVTHPQEKRLDATHNFLKYDKHGYLHWSPKRQTENANKTKAEKDFGYTTETVYVVKKTHEGMRVVDPRTEQKTRNEEVRERQEKTWRAEAAEEKRKLEKQEMFDRSEKEKRAEKQREFGRLIGDARKIQEDCERWYR